ncbi:MAG TPA: family 10 glycosylhydrolase [Bacteroidota bacterium]|nr:family 10 glycosylhydrolase [Bacteroidota bacterium]
MKLIVQCLFLLSLVCATLPVVFAEDLLLSALPKREFRAAWIASVTNLDWPSSPGGDPQVQRNQLATMLDNLKALGINAVVFQIRPECDALYASSIDPWSYWLTGAQGVPPNPFYDPLEFAVQEAHNRGMELHAWFNPYRSVRTVGSYTISPNHVSVLHPEWNITIGAFKFLDPGLPLVRDYVAGVVTDVVRRYDVDGVHFDDYFYPYPPSGITNQDDSTFAQYPRGFTNRGDWRRDNVNLLVQMVHDSIQNVKPWVKFGISPFGIWKNGVPPGIVGLDAYSEIYCDATAWLRQWSIDYLTPQLYWPFGGGQDYGRLMPWWADSTRFYSRHFYPGEAAYRITTWPSPSEMPNHIRLDRTTPDVGGNVFFRANVGLLDNPRGFADSLKNDFYRFPSLLPIMAFKDSVDPYMPRNIRYARLPGNGPAAIQWDIPITAPDGDSASRYVVYRFNQPPVLPGDLDSASHIVAIEGRRYSIPATAQGGGPYYFIATSLDRNFNESETSSLLMISAPAPPALAYPSNGAQNLPPTMTLGWTPSVSLASSYHLQVSPDSFFSTIVVNDSSIADTFKVISGLGGQQTFYWRVRSKNAGGASGFSSAWSFRTGFPVAPVQLSPANFATDVPIDPTLVWMRSEGADSYRLQVATSFDFALIVIDSSGFVDTSYGLSQTQGNTVYFWRLTSTNSLGTSAWSPIWRFRTVVTSITQTPGLPTEFALTQNYPNPFNPLTTILFSVPEAVKASLVVYDILGREVDVLIDDVVQPGNYQVQFDGTRLSSGVYFYRLVAGRYVATYKMQLVK